MAEQNPRMAHTESNSPALGAVAITGSAQVLDTSGRGLLITTTGDIEFVMQDGSTVEWTGVPVGIYALTVKSITSATAAGYVLL